MIDITVLLRPGTPEWPGDAPWSCGWTSEMRHGASVNLSHISGSPHVGTHADARLHVRSGAAGSDALPLDAFMGMAMVIDLVSGNVAARGGATAASGERHGSSRARSSGPASGDGATAANAAPFSTLDDALAAYDPARDGERLLVRTGTSITENVFPDSWPSITPSLARSLTARGMRLFGVDAPSVDARESKTLDVHHALFDGGACVLENLDLRNAPSGSYELIALPLRLQGLDAAPVRAVLRARRA